MDVAVLSPYVRGVELLLFLSAMLAGLLSGDRIAEARQVEPTAVAAAAFQLGSPVVEAGSEAVALRPLLAGIFPVRGTVPTPSSDAEPSALARVDERRLE